MNTHVEDLIAYPQRHFRRPDDARSAGIETVYQNLALSPALSIADNLFLGRERRKGRGTDRAAAGVRSFSIVALLGALAQAVAVAGLVPVGALVVGAMAALAYLRSRSRDPGLTTELALIATYLVGVLAMRSPAKSMCTGCGQRSRRGGRG